jgi:hypothetical protein
MATTCSVKRSQVEIKHYALVGNFKYLTLNKFCNHFTIIMFQV